MNTPFATAKPSLQRPVAHALGTPPAATPLPVVAPLPYVAGPLQRLTAAEREPWTMLLDSAAHATHPHARFDILVAEPVTTLITRGGITEIERDGRLELAQGDPFSLVRRELARSGISPAATSAGLPFAGGAVGYFGYDLGRRIERLQSRAEDDRRWPQMAVGIYRWALVTDHLQRASWLCCCDPQAFAPGEFDALARRLGAPIPAHGAPQARLSGLVSNLDARGYAEAFERIARYIREGDVYQVNLAQRFSAQLDGDPLAAYLALRSRSPAPFSAWLDLPFGQVASVSPERFLQVRDGHVQTRPIKGTRPRPLDPRDDAAAAAALTASAKDRAENVMIVDLLRNDLGRCCKVGSVRVPRLFEIESFAHVHHLVSEVTGDLAEGHDSIDLLRACFPGGSITGAPKLRAMQIIEELEPHRRGVYCGAIGYVGFDGAMDINIAIRTAMIQDGRIDYWAGGGIVADSDPGLEYAETFAKAGVFLALAEAGEP